MIPNNNHLPHQLQKIANNATNTSTFNNFTLKTKPPTETTTLETTMLETTTQSHHVTYDMSEQVLEELVVLNENTLQAEAARGIIQLAYNDTSTAVASKSERETTSESSENNVEIINQPEIVVIPQDHITPIPRHRGKNIDTLKACYDENEKQLIKTESNGVSQNEDGMETFVNKRKRKRTTKPVIGSGRPTNDQAMVKIANENEEDNTLSCRQLLLLSSTGEIRKKTTIYTKHTADLKCFGIKHYSSFCLIAEQRKEALETIKKQRTLLEQLGYIETCLLPLVRDNNTF
jgi:hypothetical protein